MISINISETVWTVINFFLLYFLLKRFLYNPLIKFMDDRQARIDEKLRIEQDAKTQIEENNERLLAEKTKSREEAKQILSETEQKLDEMHAAVLAEAKQTAEQNRKDAMTALEVHREQTAEKLQASKEELAAMLADRLLSEE